MENSTKIKVSQDFKKMAIKAILSIGLFIGAYLLMLAIAIALTLSLGGFGIAMIFWRPNTITIILGLGLLSVGGLLLIFLLKFLFKKYKVDRSHLKEITQKSEPELFSFIQEIVVKAGTQFPKKVYVSSEVNAAVFYDSSFWSMFLPIRKNLQIGLGLLNSVSVSEFKAILAHEFGHFSQRTMKIGSYVYNVNHVIYNMLYDNESFSSLSQKWANVSGYFAFFVDLSIRMVRGIQWILQKVYAVVNVNYMGLSREMEFHADQIAASISGAKPVISSLLRSELADYSYNTVLDYYNNKISEGVKTQNFYPQQRLVMDLLAKEREVPVVNGWPMVSIDHLNKYNKSKLIIKDQWASHPSTQERIASLEPFKNMEVLEDFRPASVLFKNIQDLENTLTTEAFSMVTYDKPAIYIDTQQFLEDFTRLHQENAFPKIFNEYYNDKHPVVFDLTQALQKSDYNQSTNLQELFSNQMVDLVYEAIALSNDIQVLEKIQKKEYDIKKFDYDGHKYSSKEIPKLKPGLVKNLENISSKIQQNDVAIFRYLYGLAEKSGQQELLRKKYDDFFFIDKDYDQKIVYYYEISAAAEFIQYDLPVETIQTYIKELNKKEQAFREVIQEILQQPLYLGQMPPEIKESFEKYLSKPWYYFNSVLSIYDQEAVDVLFWTIHIYRFLLSKTFLQLKKDLLHLQAQLISEPVNVSETNPLVQE